MKKERVSGLIRILPLLMLLIPAYVEAQATVQQQIAMAKELIPAMKTVTIVCNVADVQPILRDIKAATTTLGLELSIFDVKAFPEIFKVFRSFTSKSVDLIWMVPDTVAGGDKLARRFLIENCIKKKIPLNAFSEDVLHEGALMFMSMKDNQPAYYINKAAAALMEFKLPAQMESKVTQIE